MKAKIQAGLTSLQCRAARAALRLNVRELAERAGVSRTTIVRFEGDQTTPIPATLAALRRTFEAAGVEFLNGNGLRVRAF